VRIGWGALPIVRLITHKAIVFLCKCDVETVWLLIRAMHYKNKCCWSFFFLHASFQTHYKVKDHRYITFTLSGWGIDRQHNTYKYYQRPHSGKLGQWDPCVPADAAVTSSPCQMSQSWLLRYVKSKAENMSV